MPEKCTGKGRGATGPSSDLGACGYRDRRFSTLTNQKNEVNINLREDNKMAIYNAETLAKHLGISATQFHALVRERVIPKVGTGRYDVTKTTQAVIRHYMEKAAKGRKPELQNEKVRLTKARADHAEIELKARRGELLNAEEVKQAAFDMARITRDALLNIPDRIAAGLAVETDQHRVREMLTTALYEALERLSDGLEN